MAALEVALGALLDAVRAEFAEQLELHVSTLRAEFEARLISLGFEPDYSVLGPPLSLEDPEDSLVQGEANHYSALDLVDLEAEIARELRSYGELCPEMLAERCAKRFRLGSQDCDTLAWAILAECENLGLEPAGNGLARLELLGTPWLCSDAAPWIDGLRHLGDLPDDVSPRWRYMVGHCFYLDSLRCKGAAHAARYFGKYARPLVPGDRSRNPERVDLRRNRSQVRRMISQELTLGTAQ